MRTCFVESRQVTPYGNLALEKCLLEAVPADTVILYLWQNQRSVVIGKNQNAWRECRTEALAQDGGFLARRLSGGGAVYHDLGNLNFTFLYNSRDYDLERQLAVILRAVRRLGLSAQRTGRNDLAIDGRKFSGSAFYASGGKAYHHGTLMVDTDLDALSRYLNVDPLKLKSKGVASVKSRVVNLKSYRPDLTIAQLKEELLSAFGEVYGTKPLPLAEGLLDETRRQALTEQYASWQWLYGAKIPFTHELRTRFAWGGVELQLAVSQGQVAQAAVYSDALDGELFGNMGAVLCGARYQRDALIERLLTLRTEANAEQLAELAQFLQENI